MQKQNLYYSLRAHMVLMRDMITLQNPILPESGGRNFCLMEVGTLKAKNMDFRLHFGFGQFLATLPWPSYSSYLSLSSFTQTMRIAIAQAHWAFPVLPMLTYI
jgi:hypothetical protein